MSVGSNAPKLPLAGGSQPGNHVSFARLNTGSYTKRHKVRLLVPFEAYVV